MKREEHVGGRETERKEDYSEERVGGTGEKKDGGVGGYKGTLYCRAQGYTGETR